MRRSRLVSILAAAMGAWLGSATGCAVTFEDWALLEDAAGGDGGSDSEPSAGEGGSSSGATASAGGADANACQPGLVEGCWEKADGSAFDSPQPDVFLGECLLGSRRCNQDGRWGACMGAVEPAAQDACDAGNDADCDGVPNEGCPCTGNATRPCGSDVGNCEKGTQTCSDQVWGQCQGAVSAAATDSCAEGDDANCNGTENDDCDCINGMTEPCTIGQGDCVTGTKTCVNGVLVDLGNNEPPSAPTSPDPANGETNVAQIGVFKWEAEDPDGDPLTYDVYLSKSNPPTTVYASGRTANNVLVTGLDILSTYYWRVVASDGTETTQGPVWSFSTVTSTVPNTPPSKPAYPRPVDGSGAIPTNIELRWFTYDEDQGDAVTSVVYLDTQNPPTELLDAVAGTASASFHTYSPANLQLNTKYYWKVVATDGKDEVEGDVWSFTTAAATVPPWQVLGTTGFSADKIGSTSIDVASGTVYVAFDSSPNGQANVVKLNGASWDQVGAANFAGNAVELKIVTNAATPYIVNYYASVWRLDTDTWTAIGGPGGSWADLNFSGGVPHVTAGGAGGTRLAKYNGASWDLIGAAGFSNKEAWFPKVDFNGTTPYVVYNEHMDGGHLSMKSFDGNAWSFVGPARFTEALGAGQPELLDLNMVGSVPYVIYEDSNTSEVNVMRFTGGAWERVGGGPVGYGEFPRMALLNGSPVVVFADSHSPSPCCRITARRLNGSRWDYIGGLYVSDGAAGGVDIAANATNVYVAYRDGTKGDHLTVKRF